MGGAIAALFFDDDRYVIRFPSACWGTLTILLIYLMGRDMFHPVVGCTAAVLYALAPIAIAMANFGRYPSQLQFFTALSVYCFWRTLNGRAELNHRYLLFTTLSVIAMFLSWEPSLLIAPAMIAGAMWIRRGRLQSILRDPWVWCAIGAVAVVMLLQLSHRDFKQSQRMNFGTGASDVALKTMWRYAQFDIAHFLKATSWCADMALPIAGLFGCIALMVRHAFRDAAIYLLTTLLMTSGIIALLLPVDADRYSYFLTPLLILSATASAVAAARALRKLVPQRAPAAWKWYGRMVARAVVVVLLVCAIELSAATMEWDGTFASVNPMARATRYLSGPASFLRERLQPGDIVLGTQPYLLDHQLSRESGGTKRLEQDSTLWLQTRLHLQAVLNDVRPVPLNRRDGTELVPNLASLETVFAQPRRLWFVVEKGHFNRLNVDEVDSFLRQHMDIVFEDSEAVVLIRDRRHRTAKLRSRDERTLHGAQTDFLRKDAAIIPWVIGDAAGPARSVILNPTEDRDDAGPPSLRFR
jgi:hypothetical protein